MSEITDLSVAALSRLTRSGELTAIEAVDAHLQCADRINPTTNAITNLQADRAREEAEAADKARLARREVGSLHGIPMTIKSSIAAEGFLHECGTPLRRGEVANRDATLVRRLKAHGAIVIGTTNVPEYLMAYETDNSLYGRSNSPLDSQFTPGGSSGGCAAAVAGGCAAASFGSDAGGSVRVPAHFCGLYGLKPTPGAIPRTGHWPGVAGPSTTLASVGPLTRTAEDLALLLSATCGPDGSDISGGLLSPGASVSMECVRDLKIGWFDHAWDTPVTPETRTALQTAVSALREQGLQIEEVSLSNLEQAPRIWWQQFGICLRTLIESSTPEGYQMHPLSYEAMATQSEESDMGYQDLLFGWVTQDQLRHRLLEQMEEYRVLLCPVAAVPAFRHGQRVWSIAGETVRYPSVFVYSQVFNLLGVPAATAPVGVSADGMPIGVQIVARPNEDWIVVAVAQALETALRNG